MEKNKYGLPQSSDRPHIKANKKLDLSGLEGKQVIHAETKLALRTHKKTFEKLADM